MHQNYYFLRQLAPRLQTRLSGSVLQEAFSQEKDEILFRFENPAGEELLVKATLRSDFSAVYFPERFERARRNSVDLFRDLYLASVEEVYVFLNERAFSIRFTNGHQLLFKLFGNHSNILHTDESGKVRELFHNRMTPDLQLSPDRLHRPLDQSYQAYLEAGGRFEPLFPTFGKLVNGYLHRHLKETDRPEARWQFIRETVSRLEHPSAYYVGSQEGRLVLSLLPPDEILAQSDDPVTALNTFCSLYFRTGNLAREKAQFTAYLRKRIQQTENYLARCYEKLADMEQGGKNEQLADLIMAHLHEIPPRAESVTFPSFYTGNPVQIKLKKDLSPQKNAEIYYRKARNEKIEQEQLQENIMAREEDLAGLKKALGEVDALDQLKALRQYRKSPAFPEDALADKSPAALFKMVTHLGYTILIGKNARNNDILTRQYAFKEDLWLHAKDVPGSHVVVKYQAGKPFPAPVIERAAQLAAWHSRRRGDSLCPVTVTPRKFVRKAKGLPEGAVIIEKEKVVMVEPRA